MCFKGMLDMNQHNFNYQCFQFKAIGVVLLLLISSCSPSTEKNHLNSLQSERFPGLEELDSVAELHADQLYQWDSISYERERNLSNQHDLEIKIDRKIRFTHNSREYQLLPFFRKGHNKSKILFLHLLLLDADFDLVKLEYTSFDELTRLYRGKAYYTLNGSGTYEKEINNR